GARALGPCPRPDNGSSIVTSVIIVDDHSIFRSGLRADLDDTIEVLGEAADVDSAVALVAELRPEVVVLDVHLPGGAGVGAGPAAGGAGGAGSGGAEVIRRSAELLDTVRFLALSVS